MAIRGGKKIPDKRGFVDGPGGYRGRDDRDPGFGDAGSSNSSGTDGGGGNVTNTNVNTGVTTNVTNTNPTTGETTNVTFGGPDPRNRQPTYNPNILGAYFGYYNPDYAPSPSTITTPSAVGDVPSTPFPATEISSNVSSGYSPIGSNPGNNFFSSIGSGISNLASNINMGNVLGSAIGNMIAPGIGGLLGGYIGNTYGDDDPSNNFFGNLGENLKTDFGDTVDFFSPDVKAVDPSLDTSGLTIDDLTGSEITDTVDPVNEIGLGTLYGPKVTDILYQDPNALPDNPMYGPDELQRRAGGSSYGLPGSDYTSPTAPSESAVQRPTIADVTNKPTPRSMPMSYGDLNIFQSGPVQGLTLTNEQDQLNKEAMTELIRNVVEDFDGAKPYFQDPNSTFRTITPGEMYAIGAPSNEVARSGYNMDQLIADVTQGRARPMGGYYMQGYNVDEEGNPSLDTDQSTRNMLYGPQEKPVFDYGNNISLVDNPSDPYGTAQSALEEALHYDSANSPMPNTLGEFDYAYNRGVIPGASYSFDEGEETMVKEMIGAQNDLDHLRAVGYNDIDIGRVVPFEGPAQFGLQPQQYESFLDQFGFTQKKPGASFLNQGGLVPPISGPMSNGIGVLYKNK
tara:strand:- start:58 stop:1926 length:1869 start_codon:yes stop_codon:yes gene_type:complete